MLRHTNTLRVNTPRDHWTPAHVAVAWYLADRMNDQDEAWPSMSTIAAACRLSARQARRIVAQLEADGIIARDYQTNRSTVYLWTNWPLQLVADRSPMTGGAVTHDRSGPVTHDRLIDQGNYQETIRRHPAARPVDNRREVG